MKKPADLLYGVEERPPFPDSLIVALQHVLTIAVNLVYPLLLARQAGLGSEAAADMLRLGMIALAAGVMLQAIPRGPVGCHFLAPVVYASPYLAPGALAVQMGGMHLFWGMIIVAGAAMVIFASIWDRLRAFIPPESAGLVVFLVGATIGVAALRLLIQSDGTVGPAETWITLVTLAVMIALNIWGRGRLRLFSILVGVVIGYLIAVLSGVVEGDTLRAIAALPLLSLPDVGHMGWSFDATLIIPFVVTALAISMISTAIVTSYQKMTDADWARPEMKSISGGIRSDGIGTAFAGLLCSFGIAIGPANAGLVGATGVASRVVAPFIAVILLLAGLLPAFAGLLAVMPAPVMAAGLLFPAAFIMISGLQIISSRVLDARRTVVIGAGILTFLLVAMFPRIFASAPDWLQPIVASPLVFATVVALALNLVFRIGIKRSVEIWIDSDAPELEKLENFIERNAASWGARRDVIARMKFALVQTLDALAELRNPRSAINLTMTYDELDIEAKLGYEGEPLMLPESAPTREELKQAGGERLLAGLLIRRQADRAHFTIKDGLCVLHLRFRQ